MPESFAAWLHGTRLSLFFQSVTWLWAACETLHFMGLALLIGIAGFFDLRLLGFMRRVPLSAARDLIPWAIRGFVLNLVTGLVFFTTAPARYVNNGAFWFKMFFVLVAGLNAMFFETRLGARVLTMGADQDTPMPFKIVGAVSLFAWLAVLYFGRMLPYADQLGLSGGY